MSAVHDVLDDRLVVAVYARRAGREETEGIERQAGFDAACTRVVKCVELGLQRRGGHDCLARCAAGVGRAAHQTILADTDLRSSGLVA